jgi:hypothetical protein
MSYPVGHANAQIAQSLNRCRGARPPGGLTVGRCLYPPPLPDPAGQCAGATCPRDCDPPRLRRPDRAQRDSCLQCMGPGRLTAWIIGPPPHPACHLRRRPPRAATYPAAPEPTDVWPAHQRLDTAARGRRRLCRGYHAPAGQRRSDSPRLGRPQDALEAGQTLDHQSRPNLCPQKNSATASSG